MTLRRFAHVDIPGSGSSLTRSLKASTGDRVITGLVEVPEGDFPEDSSQGQDGRRCTAGFFRVSPSSSIASHDDLMWSMTSAVREWSLNNSKRRGGAPDQELHRKRL